MVKKISYLLLVCLLLGGALLLTACDNKAPIDNPNAPVFDPLAKPEATLEFTLLDDGTYSVSKGALAYAKEIVIPETYNGKPVTRIAASGFLNSTMNKITIPASIKVIGAKAFSGCTELTDIKLPNGIESIPAGAFADCLYLEELTIPSSVREIGNDAFSGCTAFTKFVVPEGVERIGANAFYGCKNLSSISLPSTLTVVGNMAFAVIGEETLTEPHNLTYYELDGDRYLGNESNPRIVLVKMGNSDATSYTVHQDTRVIYNYAFASSKLTAVTLHDKVGNIGARAFRSCTKLTSIHIPDSVTVIGDAAFYYCTNLKEITGMNKIVTLGDMVFYNCRRMKTLNIGSTLQTIGVNAFTATSALQALVEKNITYIGNTENPYLILLRVNDKTLDDYEINPNTKIIYQAAFSDCTKLWEITIPEGVFKIGHNAFSGCKALGTLKLPNSLSVIEPYAFNGCSRLATAVVPKHVTYIGIGAFSGCNNLSSITLPFVGQTATGAGSSIFGHIFGATSIGKHPTIIPKGLQTVVLTNCTTIGGAAFSDCENIVNITLPETLKVIEVGAFYFTKGIKNVYIKDVAAWCAVEIPASNSTPMWNGATLYLNKKKLETLEIPDTVTDIKAYTFFGCTTLKSLSVPDSVTTIWDYAFDGCANLASVTLGNGVTSIRSSAFKNCKSLTDVKLSDSLVSLDSDAFRGCVLLKEIVLPQTLNFIGDHAFKNCDALTSVTFKSKFGWYICPDRLLTDGEKINVWFSRKNAEALTEERVDSYWTRID